MTKLKALLEGLEIENPDYWVSRSEKELHDMGRCISNGITKLDNQLVIDALIECSDRIRIWQDNGRAKTLDNVAIDNADYALSTIGVYKCNET